MDETIRAALAGGLTCDITTIGRTSGLPRRIEIWYFVIDGRVYLTGTPGRRDWYANLLAQPQLTFHVKQGARADLPARAVPIAEPAERRRIMETVLRYNSWFATQSFDLDAWVAGSPLVAVEFD
jgi:deazaflavin-dependent oxidoreductase (nitroreductase family)